MPYSVPSEKSNISLILLAIKLYRILLLLFSIAYKEVFS